MDRRRHQEAQLRQLRRELPTHPWLFARLGGLLLRAGRSKEALALLRKGTREHEHYLSGWQVLAEALDLEGEEREAATIRESICQQVPGIHAAWAQRVQAARQDPERHLELLRRVWELDQFSPQRNVEMEQAGLRRSADYEQALRPTAAEAIRREEQFRRLLDQHVRPSAAVATAGPESGAPLSKGEPAAIQVLIQDEPQAEAEDRTRGPQAEEEPTPSSPCGEEGFEPEGEDGELEPGEAPAARPGREENLREQADRLDSLTRPLNLRMPRSLPEDPTRRVTGSARDLFDPRSMMTRRLARIYLEQGYPGLALRVLEALAQREPNSEDLPGLLEQARAEERRLAETPSPRTRRKA